MYIFYNEFPGFPIDQEHYFVSISYLIAYSLPPYSLIAFLVSASFQPGYLLDQKG
jgi:hypothetical protein